MIKTKFNNNTKVFTVNITGEIGRSFFGDGITLNSVIEQIQTANPESIVLNVSSLGGDLVEGLGIHDYLKALDKPVIANIIGTTASAGTVIAMAADETYISPNARYLIHRASTMTEGNADDIQRALADLQVYDNTIVNLYTGKTGKTEEEIRNLMKENRFLTAQEAIDYGFVNGYLTKISNNSKINNMDEEQAKAMQAENEALKAQIAELQAKLAELTGKAEKDEEEMIDAEIEAAIEAGKISDTEKDVYTNFGKGNLKALREKLKAIEPKVKVFNYKPERPDTANDEKMTWDYLYRHDSKKLQDLKINNFALFNQIFKNKYGTDYKKGVN
jgi:ATP-dependent protease ClpP protease subunit